MRDSIKYCLFILYLIAAFAVTLADMSRHYGVDSMMFWWFIRPFISVLKGILWPITVWF